MKEEKIKCYDCGKEVKLDEKKNIIDGVLLEYETPEKLQIFKCNTCYEKDPSLHHYQKCEVYSRVVGYLRPITQWNEGKKQEYKDRKNYK